MTSQEKKPPSKYGRNPEAKKVFWDTVRLEYVSTAITMVELAEKYKTGRTNVFSHSRKEKWRERRKLYRQKVANRVETKLVSKGVKEWGRQIRLFGKIDKQIERILKKYDEGDSGTMDPRDIKTLADSLTESLKGQKLIKGESTGEETNVSFSMKVVKFIQEREKEVEQQNAVDVDGTAG